MRQHKSDTLGEIAFAEGPRSETLETSVTISCASALSKLVLRGRKQPTLGQWNVATYFVYVGMQSEVAKNSYTLA